MTTSLLSDNTTLENIDIPESKTQNFTDEDFSSNLTEKPERIFGLKILAFMFHECLGQRDLF